MMRSIIIAFLLCVFFPSISWACKSMQDPSGKIGEQVFEKAAFVGTVKVLSFTDPNADTVEVEYEVLKNYKTSETFPEKFKVSYGWSDCNRQIGNVGSVQEEVFFIEDDKIVRADRRHTVPLRPYLEKYKKDQGL